MNDFSPHEVFVELFTRFDDFNRHTNVVLFDQLCQSFIKGIALQCLVFYSFFEQTLGVIRHDRVTADC